MTPTVCGILRISVHARPLSTRKLGRLAMSETAYYPTKREWVEAYLAWKTAHPHLATEAMKPFRSKLVRGCRRKAWHPSYAAAMAIVEKLECRPGRVVHAYRCDLCGNFHVGNTSAALMGKKDLKCAACHLGFCQHCTGCACTKNVHE